MSSSSVSWLPWSAAAFARARDEVKPVLLSIGASWCQGCGVMDRTTYADRRIVSSIHDSVIPVRVDADRRPDIHERYHLEGLPTTVFLTPSGEMLTGTTYLPPSGLAGLLDEVSGAYSRDRERLDARARSAASQRRAGVRRLPMVAEPDLSAPAWIASRLVQELDREFGGFGTGGKFLHAPALLAGVLHYEREPSAGLAGAIAGTLDGMARGGIRDHVQGGFFRYAGSREWMRPHTEKMLEDQAAMARVYLEAARIFGRPDWDAVAREVIDYVNRTLADPGAGEFFASQAADETYYQLQSTGVAGGPGAPRVDRTLFMDWTAQACSTWLRAAAITGNAALSTVARSAMDRAIGAMHEPGTAAAHYFDGAPRVRGLLSDQVHAARALLDLFDATRHRPYLDRAHDLVRTALDTLWDGEAGGFLDRPPSDPDAVGLLGDPRRPLAANAVAASVLARLARVTGDATLQQRALETLRAHSAGYREQGLAGAPYALAIIDIFDATGAQPATP